MLASCHPGTCVLRARAWLVLAAALSLGSPGWGLDDANADAPEHAPVLREVQPFHATITVVNPYDRAVRVKMLDASCSCAHLDLGSHFLLPHASTTLAIDVDDANRSGPQDIRVSVYLSDPDLEPIECTFLWSVRPCVAVDSLPPGNEAAGRPADRGWQDIYRFVAEERPDEPQRLRKHIYLSCPPEEAPKDGLQILGIDYQGALWQLTPRKLDNGAWLIVARAKPGLETMPEGTFHETAVVHTNHPDKPAITLHFDCHIAKDAGAPPDATGGGPAPSPAPAPPAPAPAPVPPTPAPK